MKGREQHRMQRIAARDIDPTSNELNRMMSRLTYSIRDLFITDAESCPSSDRIAGRKSAPLAYESQRRGSEPGPPNLRRAWLESWQQETATARPQNEPRLAGAANAIGRRVGCRNMGLATGAEALSCDR